MKEYIPSSKASHSVQYIKLLPVFDKVNISISQFVLVSYIDKRQIL